MVTLCRVFRVEATDGGRSALCPPRLSEALRSGSCLYTCRSYERLIGAHSIRPSGLESRTVYRQVKRAIK